MSANSLEEFPCRGLTFIPVDVGNENPRLASVGVHEESVPRRE